MRPLRWTALSAVHCGDVSFPQASTQSELSAAPPTPASTSPPPSPSCPALDPVIRCVPIPRLPRASTLALFDFSSPQLTLATTVSSHGHLPNRNYGSSKVGAYAGVSTHRYVAHPKIEAAKALKDNTRAVQANNGLTLCVDRVSKPPSILAAPHHLPVPKMRSAKTIGSGWALAHQGRTRQVEHTAN